MADTEPITHHRVLKVAIPIVLANVTVPILGAVDTGVVGQMGAAAPIGAVGIGAVILSALYWVFGFLRMGTTGLTSQALGAGNLAEVSALFVRALMIGATAGLVIILAQMGLFAAAFAISPASAEVEALAGDYMAIRVWSAPATIALYGVTGWLIAQERARAVLLVQLLMNGANIVLDLIFVLVFDWGVEGVAWATFIAEWSGLVLGLWLCRSAFDVSGWSDRARLFDPAKLRRMASVNADILIRSVLLQAIFLSFLFFGSDFGDVELAANQVLLQFLHVTGYALDGFAFAAETFVGQAVGAGLVTRLRRAAILSGLWGVLICALLSIGFAIFGPVLIDIMTTASDVRTAALIYLPYMVAAPLIGVASWMLDGIFIGATRTKDMRNMMLLSAAIYFAAVIPLMAVLGNHGLWLGLLVSFIARGVTLGSRYRSLEASIVS